MLSSVHFGRRWSWNLLDQGSFRPIESAWPQTSFTFSRDKLQLCNCRLDTACCKKYAAPLIIPTYYFLIEVFGHLGQNLHSFQQFIRIHCCSCFHLLLSYRITVQEMDQTMILLLLNIKWKQQLYILHVVSVKATVRWFSLCLLLFKLGLQVLLGA